jgi:hypothetical protein
MRHHFMVFSLILILMLTGCSRKSTSDSASPGNPPAETTASTAPAVKPEPAATPELAATPAPAVTPPVVPRAKPAPPPAPPKPVVVPAGAAITVRLDQALGSKTSHTGDTFSATVNTPVSVGGKVAIPASSTVGGTVVEAKAKGKFKGEARLQLALKKITIKGVSYLIDASMANLTEKGKGKRTAKTTGAGAAGGALIGGLAGGGKGLAIGAVVGAGAGLVGGAMTGNKQIELPAESSVTFQLNEPLTLK